MPVIPSTWIRCALCVLLVATFDVAAQSSIEREGYFEVRSASSNVVDGVHRLDARLQLVLSSDALSALDAGVPLTIELQIEVIRNRRFVPDAQEAELKVRYELEYRPLSERYLVRNLNSGNQESFATLYSALNTLGRVQGLPLIDDELLTDDRQYRGRMRALLSTRQYPQALRYVFFWRSEWQLKSDWFPWTVER